MGVIMGVMMVIMVAGFIGHGHHGLMMGGYEGDGQKEEVILKEQAKEPPCIDCSAGTGSEKAEGLRPAGISDEQYPD